MSESDQSSGVLKQKQATKCDRQTPCSSCVTLQVNCTTSRRALEKRQRVLLSPRYEEAVQDVNHQLADVKGMLEKLMLSKDIRSSPQSITGPEQVHQTSKSMIDEQVPTLFGVQEGYNGESSFQTHAHRIKNALEEIINVETPATSLSPLKVRELLQGTSASEIGSMASGSNSPRPNPNTKPQNMGIGNLPLPPMDVVLKVVRIAKIDKQRFFLDVPFISEDEFIDMCRDIYFATEPVSLWLWITVNVGLYYLFLSINEANCMRMGTAVDQMRSQCQTLRANAEAALQSLRLASEPSLESCRALALLGTFYVKEGHSTIAWRLISGAARAALDLGFHHLPNNLNTPDISRKRHVFWYIYSWDKGLSVACGRTPLIHHYDVTTISPLFLENMGSVSSLVYGAWLQNSIVTAEVQQHLFSASARQASQQSRIQYARQFASRIKEVQKSVRTISKQDPNWNELFAVTVVTIEIMMYSLLTIVYRVIPPSCPQPHPLQCSDECVESARMALTTLVKVGRNMLQINSVAWGMILNVILSLVPFVPFIVLAGNAVVTSSTADLELLNSVVAVLEPVAISSQTTQKMFDVCERFGRVTSLIVSSASPHGAFTVPGQFHDENSSSILHHSASAQVPVYLQQEQSMQINSGFPMAQQDWDSAMMGFESELGDYDARTLTNIIEPYFASSGWGNIPPSN